MQLRRNGHSVRKCADRAFFFCFFVFCFGTFDTIEMQTEQYRANIRKENFDSQPILKCYSIEISSNSKTLTKMNIRLSFSLQRLKALLKTETYEYGFKERISENWS